VAEITQPNFVKQTRNQDRPEELLTADDEDATNFKQTNDSTQARLRP
jgi:hypothetical protein